MTSSVPYDPEGFEADSNPFAHETSMSSSTWGDTPSPAKPTSTTTPDSIHDDSANDLNKHFQKESVSTLTPNSTSSPHDHFNPPYTGDSKHTLPENSQLDSSVASSSQPTDVTLSKEQQPTENDISTTENPNTTVTTNESLTSSLITNGNDEQATTSPAPPTKSPKKKYKLILKVTGLERNGKKDPIIRFDAYVCLLLFIFVSSYYLTSIKLNIHRQHFQGTGQQHLEIYDEHIMSSLSLELI